MGYYDVHEEPTDETQAQFDGKSGDDTSRRNFNITLVGLNPSFETTETVKAFAPIPRFGDLHPSNPAKYCNNVNVLRKGPIYFTATCEYTMRLGPSGQNQKPTDQQPEIAYSTAISEESIDQDMDSHAIITKTGESFEPPIRRPFADLVITVVRNVTADQYSPENIPTTIYRTNTDTFTVRNKSYPPGTCLITKFEANEIFQSDGTSYFRRAAAIQVRRGAPRTTDEKAWYWRQLAAGYYWNMPLLTIDAGGHVVRLSSQSVQRVRCYDQHGEPSTKPMLHQVANGQPFFKSDNATIDYERTAAEWYEFKIYESHPFANAQIL